MSDRVRRRRSRDVRASPSSRRLRDDAGLSPSCLLRIAADVHRHSTSDDDSGCVLEEYAWWPSGLKPDMVHLYFRCLPEDKIPFVGSPGDKWRARQLRHQMPPQDSDARYCAGLAADEQEELRMFDRARKSECIGVGLVQRVPYDGKPRRCSGCSTHLEEGSICVVAGRTESSFHPACFHCNECRTLLVDLVYFAHEGKVFCGRHHAEQIKPRCARCDELILGEECTEAEGRTWHLHHFQCHICADVLGGKTYMQRNGKPVCMSCHGAGESAVICATCDMVIPTNQPHITQGDFHWHTAASCFNCSVCAKNLLGIDYTLAGGRLFCGNNGCQSESPFGDSGFGEMMAVRSPQRRPTNDRRPPRQPRAMPSPRLAPRPPQRAPPPPPAENIYETVLPCTSSSPEFEKKYGSESDRSGNYYSKTPNGLVRPHIAEYSTSSSDSDEDDECYVSNLMAAASLNRTATRKPLPLSTVRVAKKKKSNRCIVS